MKEELIPILEQTKNLIQVGNINRLGEHLDTLNISDVEEIIDEIPRDGALIINSMSIHRAVNVFRILDIPTQERIIKKLPQKRMIELINDLPVDDMTSLLAELKDKDLGRKLISLLSPEGKSDVATLLSYPEDSVGRLMTTDYLTINKDLTVDEALQHIRKHGGNSETIDVIYILDSNGVLLDDLRIRNLLVVDPSTKISDLMDDRLIFLNADDHQEDAIQVFKMNARVALPVIDQDRKLLGIVTIDDILWVADEEYMEDMQRFGGTEALDEPYLDLPVLKLIKKRAGWLIILFIGELATASVMQYYEAQLAKVIVLTTFLPLMIASGGNSGSQASTLIIQAMAMGEIKLSDWIRVFKREIFSGLGLGIILGLIGFLRIYVWHHISPDLYGDIWMYVALTVSLSLVGIVLWGSLVGSMLPFIMKRLGADPATSSAPFVATIVDVTGLILYLSVAGWVFGGVV